MDRRLLLIIDPQIDFCDPHGALYVEGAAQDMQRLSHWIVKNKSGIDHIIVSGDWHHVNNIAHPSFWSDSHGNFPSPFTTILYEEVEGGKWTPRFFRDEAMRYVKALEDQGEFQHFIWPFHCIIGSTGASICAPVLQSLMEWSRDGKFYQFITKGTYPVSEHFGIFRANIPDPSHPETLLNIRLIQQLEQYEQIVIAGEARSHCVANSVNQIIQHAPHLLTKIVFLEDCMSDVKGLEHLGDSVYQVALSMGATLLPSKDLSL